MQYLTNLRTYLWGWTQLGADKIPGGYKPGWGPLKFSLVYLLNIGTNVLTGGAVSTWSRSFYEYRRSGVRLAKFLDRLLGKLDEDHGEESAPAYWGTSPCEPAVRVVVTLLWVILAGVVLFS